MHYEVLTKLLAHVGRQLVQQLYSRLSTPLARLLVSQVESKLHYVFLVVLAYHLTQLTDNLYSSVAHFLGCVVEQFVKQGPYAIEHLGVALISKFFLYKLNQSFELV